MNGTNLKGAIAEAKILAAATELGIAVYSPVAEHGRADMLFEVGDRMLRIQCKWAPRQGDVVCVRAYTSARTRTGMRVRPYTAAEIDHLAAYCADLDRCYLIPAAMVESHRQIHLRLAPARNNQRGGVNWAAPLEFSAIEWSRLGAVAQLEERRHGMAEARGSSPLSSTSTASRSSTHAIGSHEFRNRFGYYLEEAAAGRKVSVSRHGKPYAALVPPDGDGDGVEPSVA